MQPSLSSVCNYSCIQDGTDVFVRLLSGEYSLQVCYFDTNLHVLIQLFFYEYILLFAFQSHQNYQEFPHYTLDDVDSAFDKIIQLKYSQHVSLKGKYVRSDL